MIFATILAVLVSSIYPVLADDVNVSVTVQEPSVSGILARTLAEIGSGTGSIFSSMGTPLLVFIILMSLGTAIGYLFEVISQNIGSGK